MCAMQQEDFAVELVYGEVRLDGKKTVIVRRFWGGGGGGCCLRV